MRANRHITVGEFEPLFDWSPEAATAEPPINDVPPVEVLRAACRRHLAKEGHLLVRHFTGAGMTNAFRRFYGFDKPAGPLCATYQTGTHADPLGALLDGQRYGCGAIVDAARILKVDEYWMAGFLHGYDNTPPELIGRRRAVFQRSVSYSDGRTAGRALAEEFKPLKKGWEIEASQ